ncbi:LacI family DNA-binding transcriptional regulator [Sphingomonas hengshuiensis]|uniref:LacI family DNA-binding transcriptional regulator n=1 Tax=Sphingomonas hengshuiensis TaxID=1609977 RepID=UPI0005C9AF93|nr:LacI family DNA-binding transcriptional regulator [Sphingomonas hengshuiensis]
MTVRRTLASPPERVTLHSVAARAGVSTMTVSRVVNCEGRVKPRTREAVERAIRELNYVPNAAAKALAAGRQAAAIALLLDTPSATMLADMLCAVMDAPALSSDRLSFLRVRDKDGPADTVSRLRGMGVRGVVLTAPLCDNLKLRRALSQAGIRIVAIDCDEDDPDVSAIGIDDRRAAFALTVRLLALGHRRIGFIAGPAGQRSSARRRAGFESALAQFGVEPDASLQWTGDYSFQGTIAIAEQMLSLTPRPTAIFASNDAMAAAVVSVAGSWGVSVPGSLSVCGFDDAEIARMMFPPLTTVAPPLGAMAVWAVGQLNEELDAIEQGREPPVRKVTRDYQLAFRGTTAPPRGNAGESAAVTGLEQ